MLQIDAFQIPKRLKFLQSTRAGANVVQHNNPSDVPGPWQEINDARECIVIHLSAFNKDPVTARISINSNDRNGSNTK